MGISKKLNSIGIAVIDIILVNLGFSAAFGLRFNLNWPVYNLQSYFDLIPWLSLTAVVLFYMFDLYADWRRKSIYNLYYSIVLSVLILTLSTMALSFWNRGFSFPRSVITLAPIFQIFFLCVSRSIFWYLSKRVFGQKKVLIVAKDNDNAIALAEKLHAHIQGWFVIHDFVSEADLGLLKQKLSQVDVVLLSSDLKYKIEVINHSSESGKEVLLVPDLLDLCILGSEMQQVDDMMVLSIAPPMLLPGQLLVKRVFDIVVSLATMILLSPIIITLYILIPLTSKGPALFRQDRAGKDGKIYKMLKFRSMVEDAEQATGPVLAGSNDQRVTQIGKMIRTTRLDELPQLINVLKGEMSLVGPRPERPYFIQQFQTTIPHYDKRLAVKPGITGLAQVMANYSTTVEDKLRFDLSYVRNYSFGLDIKILLQTIRVVLQREQAAGVKEKAYYPKEELLNIFKATPPGKNI